MAALRLSHTPQGWHRRFRSITMSTVTSSSWTQKSNRDSAGDKSRLRLMTSDQNGRVENRRSGFSLSVAFGLGFRFAASIRFGLALFPVPAHRTGQAELPHPALGKDSRCYV